MIYGIAIGANSDQKFMDDLAKHFNTPLELLKGLELGTRPAYTYAPLVVEHYVYEYDREQHLQGTLLLLYH